MNDGKMIAAQDRSGAAPPSGEVVRSLHKLSDDDLDEPFQLSSAA